MFKNFVFYIKFVEKLSYSIFFMFVGFTRPFTLYRNQLSYKRVILINLMFTLLVNYIIRKINHTYFVKFKRKAILQKL